MKKDAGFSVLELMIVIVILGALTAIAIPAYNRFIPGYRLTAAAQELQSDINLAKLIAIKNSAVVSIRPNTATETYDVFFDNGSGANRGNGVRDTSDPKETLIKTIGMPSGIDIVSVTTLSPPAFQFNPRGLPWNWNTGFVTLRNKRNETREVHLAMSGSATVE